VWTFVAPFIGGICNCDRSDCGAMQATVTSGFPVMFRAEYVAEVNPDLCNGCRQCMRVCQFGAIGYSAATRRSLSINCGVTAAVSAAQAAPRMPSSFTTAPDVPVAANIW
jgi:ferredoxin